jgi:polysaccharide export outer membrane protein
VPPPPAFSLKISVGDVIDVSVWGEPTLGSSQKVLPDGTVRLPVAGSVDVAGRTPSEIEAMLASRYVAGGVKEPRVTVQLKEIFAAHAFFLGEIRNPGAVYLSGPTSILQGVARVGGFMEQDADKRTIRIIRAGEGCQPKIFSVNVEEIMTGCACDVYLVPGDVVYVHPTSLAAWSRNLRQSLEPLGAILGAPAQVASVIVAVDAVGR